MMVLRLIVAVLAVCALARAGTAQSLVFGTSDPTISIHSTFAGDTITLFGNIEPDVDGTPPEGSFDIVTVVRGPVEERVVRRKARQLGIMLNATMRCFAAYRRFTASCPVARLTLFLIPRP